MLREKKKNKDKDREREKEEIKLQRSTMQSRLDAKRLEATLARLHIQIFRIFSLSAPRDYSLQIDKSESQTRQEFPENVYIYMKEEAENKRRRRFRYRGTRRVFDRDDRDSPDIFGANLMKYYTYDTRTYIVRYFRLAPLPRRERDPTRTTM